MYATPAHDPVTERQLERAIEQLYQRAETVFGRQPEATISCTVRWYLTILREESPEEGHLVEEVARQIRDAVMDRADVQLPQWWGNPLGHTLVWHGAAPIDVHSEVPKPIIAAVLGCTRQNVDKVIGKHALKHPGRPYDNIALMHALRSRWARAITLEARDAA